MVNTSKKGSGKKTKQAKGDDPSVRQRNRQANKLGGDQTQKVKLNKIRKPWSAWVLFLKNARTNNSFDTSLSFGENAKKLAEQWKRLTEEDRRSYHEASIRDRERYKKDVEEFAPPKKPKKAPSSFLFYAKKRRQELLARDPNLSFSEIASMLGKEWKSLTDADKLPYKRLSESATTEYKANMAKYQILHETFYSAFPVDPADGHLSS